MRPGAQAPVYCASPAFESESASGGSPLEKVATTCALATALAQSSVTRTLRGVGQPAGEENAFTSDELLMTSRPGAQPAANRCFSTWRVEDRTAPGGNTTRVTFAVRMVWLEKETDTSPV